MRYLDEIQYINELRLRKSRTGIGFILFWLSLYLGATVAVCIWMWMNK